MELQELQRLHEEGKILGREVYIPVRVEQIIGEPEDIRILSSDIKSYESPRMKHSLSVKLRDLHFHVPLEKVCSTLPVAEIDMEVIEELAQNSFSFDYMIKMKKDILLSLCNYLGIKVVVPKKEVLIRAPKSTLNTILEMEGVEVVDGEDE